MKPRKNIALDQTIIDIIEEIGGEPISTESDGQAGYYIVPHAALLARLEPLLSNIPMNHPLAKVRRYIDTNVDSYLWESFHDEEDKFTVNDERGMLRLIAFRALVLQILYSVPTQQRLEEFVRYSILYRWFYDDYFLLFDPPSFAEIEQELESIQPEDNIGNLLAGVIAIAEAVAPPDKQDFTLDHALLARWCSRH